MELKFIYGITTILYDVIFKPTFSLCILLVFVCYGQICTMDSCLSKF